MGKTKIEWTQKVWNPITGCSHCSPGCDNCYAERMTKRLRAMTIRRIKAKGYYKYRNGFDVVTLHEEEIERPFRWKKPTMVFVCSMSDLFHEKVPKEFIWKLFNVMKYNERHIFQVLTKRPQNIPKNIDWPDNVWCGVTVCNQKEADKKIPILLKVPAKVHFLSVEPMLGPIDLMYPSGIGDRSLIDHIDWVICGGESGPNARPMYPGWVRSLRSSCVYSGFRGGEESIGTPFFFKQWGEWWPAGKKIIDEIRDMVLFGNEAMYRIGKKRSGKKLDDKVWDQYPYEFYEWKNKYHG